MDERAPGQPASHPRAMPEPARAALLALAALALYVATLAPGVMWGDDGELQRLALTGVERSDAHGHPLWFALVRLVVALPVRSVAWRTNLFSALCAALAVGVFYLVAVRLTRARTASALAALAFAVSHTHWLHAVRTEVYALYMALFALVLLAFVAWRAEQRPWRLLLLGALAGATFLSHLLIVTALPGLALGVWACSPAGRRVRNVAWLAGGGLTGFAVFLAVSGMQALAQPVYGGGGPFSILSLPRGIDLVRCVAYTAYQFPLASPLILYGAWRACRDDAALAAALAAIALGDFGFALCFRVVDQYVFYLPAYLVLALFLACGVRALGAHWLTSGPRLALLAAALVLAPPALYRLAPAVVARTHLALVTPQGIPGRDNNLYFMFPPKNGERSAERFAAAAYAVLPESALVIADWAALEPLRYLQEVDHVRPDVALAESDPKHPRQLPWIADQLRHRPVFLADKRPWPYNDLVGLEQRFELRPVGQIFRLAPRATR